MYSIKLLVRQAGHINQYKKLKTKVLNCCANIYFNRQCVPTDVNNKRCAWRTSVLIYLLWILEEVTVPELLHQRSFHVGRNELSAYATYNMKHIHDFSKCWCFCSLNYVYFFFGPIARTGHAFSECMCFFFTYRLIFIQFYAVKLTHPYWEFKLICLSDVYVAWNRLDSCLPLRTQSGCVLLEERFLIIYHHHMKLCFIHEMHLLVPTHGDL